MATEKRLIDAKEGKKVFVALARPAEYKGVIHMVVPISEIDRLPTVNAVEVVHGRWEKGEADKHGNRKPKCSVCGEYHLAWWSDYTHCNYCPNCGAKMDGDGNG